MNPSDVFQIVNTAVLPAWIFLAVAPRWRYRNTIIYGFCMLLAAIYAFYIFSDFGSLDFDSFGSLAGVMSLFTQEEAVLAGWVHYLVFDLLIGNWVVNQSIKHEIKHIFVVPCLVLCFMLGPVGFLLFSIVKYIKTRSLE
ncbi:MAG: ABA4-like family protein [Fulvivirga sp.]